MESSKFRVDIEVTPWLNEYGEIDLELNDLDDLSDRSISIYTLFKECFIDTATKDGVFLSNVDEEDARRVLSRLYTQLGEIEVMIEQHRVESVTK